jgi:CRP/FNR family transcriptional regulator, cyclic AMP receptor protein
MKTAILTKETLKDISLFKPLTEGEQVVLIQSSEIIHVGKHRKVYSYGDSLQHVFIVLKGSVKLAAQTDANKILVKYLIYKDELFGENVFSSTKERMEFAEALSDCIILKIDAKVFKSLVGNNGELMATLANIIIGRIKDLEDRMQSFVFLKAKERITAFIRKTASLQGISIGLNEILINHGMSHKEIAYLTDTSRQTVARILNELKEANIIHFSDRKPNKILIREMAAL